MRRVVVAFSEESNLEPTQMNATTSVRDREKGGRGEGGKRGRGKKEKPNLNSMVPRV